MTTKRSSEEICVQYLTWINQELQREAARHSGGYGYAARRAPKPPRPKFLKRLGALIAGALTGLAVLVMRFIDA